MFGWFDPLYFIFLAPGLLLALWAQLRVQGAYGEARAIPASSGFSGAGAAHTLLRNAGVSGVEVEPVAGVLNDHYDPRAKVLRLSTDVFGGRSLAALGIAAHEAGHAMQDADGYPLLRLRNALVPATGLGSNLAWVIFLVGFAMHSLALVGFGVLAFSATVAFQLVNLPVEFDASRRARRALADGGLIAPGEEATVKNVLDAAAWTYVATTLTSVLTLFYFLFRSGLVGARR